MAEGKFALGTLVSTFGLNGWLSEDDGSRIRFIMDRLLQHQTGSWGDLCDEDREANDKAVQEGTRILSAYMLPGHWQTESDDRIWIITEADRSSTTILFPSEY